MDDKKLKDSGAPLPDEELDAVAGGMQKPEIDLKKYPRGDEAPTLVPPLENVANVTSSFF